MTLLPGTRTYNVARLAVSVPCRLIILPAIIEASSNKRATYAIPHRLYTPIPALPLAAALLFRYVLLSKLATVTNGEVTVGTVSTAETQLLTHLYPSYQPLLAG